jgi:cell division protein FtsB
MAASATARRSPARARRKSQPAGRIRWDRLGRYALLQALLEENASHKHRVEDLKRPLALEREARKLGMIKEGERAYVIENLGR